MSVHDHDEEAFKKNFGTKRVDRPTRVPDYAVEEVDRLPEVTPEVRIFTEEDLVQRKLLKLALKLLRAGDIEGAETCDQAAALLAKGVS